MTHRARHPALAALMTRLEALVAVDDATLDAWALPRVEDLAFQFHCSYRPLYDFRIWLREQYLVHHMPRSEGAHG